MLPARVKFGVLPALILNVIASGGTHHMAEEVQGQADEAAESSEATIAVHWREEGYYPPPPKFIGQANASDPAILRAVRGGELPRVLQGIRRPAALGQVLAHDVGHQQRAVLAWFVGGKLNASYNCVDRHLAAQEQGGADLGPRTRATAARLDHLPGAVPAGERVRRAAAGLRRAEGRRPGHPAHADGARAAGQMLACARLG